MFQLTDYLVNRGLNCLVNTDSCKPVSISIYCFESNCFTFDLVNKIRVSHSLSSKWGELYQSLSTVLRVTDSLIT